MRRILLALTFGLLPHPATAANCPDNPEALGTERILVVDPEVTPRVGRKHFPTTLPLEPKEVVLTFDDGPWPGPTSRVLDALKRECVRASFFLIGRNAAAHPELARRALTEGHTVAHHSYSHPLLRRMPLQRAEVEIERGFAAVDTALYGASHRAPITPFFRFPGFASNSALLDRLAQRGITVFGADLWASDWRRMAPRQEIRLIMQRLKAANGGILLLHDTQPHTAAMLPELLRAMKRSSYRVVHVVPARKHAAPAPSAPTPQ